MCDVCHLRKNLWWKSRTHVKHNNIIILIQLQWLSSVRDNIHIHETVLDSIVCIAYCPIKKVRVMQQDGPRPSTSVTNHSIQRDDHTHHNPQPDRYMQACRKAVDSREWYSIYVDIVTGFNYSVRNSKSGFILSWFTLNPDILIRYQIYHVHSNDIKHANHSTLQTKQSPS